MINVGAPNHLHEIVEGEALEIRLALESQPSFSLVRLSLAGQHQLHRLYKGFDRCFGGGPCTMVPERLRNAFAWMLA
jgi:hypothetical protein